MSDPTFFAPEAWDAEHPVPPMPPVTAESVMKEEIPKWVMKVTGAFPTPEEIRRHGRVVVLPGGGQCFAWQDRTLFYILPQIHNGVVGAYSVHNAHKE